MMPVKPSPHRLALNSSARSVRLHVSTCVPPSSNESGQTMRKDWTAVERTGKLMPVPWDAVEMSPPTVCSEIDPTLDMLRAGLDRSSISCTSDRYVPPKTVIRGVCVSIYRQKPRPLVPPFKTSSFTCQTHTDDSGKVLHEHAPASRHHEIRGAVTSSVRSAFDAPPASKLDDGAYLLDCLGRKDPCGSGHKGAAPIVKFLLVSLRHEAGQYEACQSLVAQAGRRHSRTASTFGSRVAGRIDGRHRQIVVIFRQG